jgi:hypothetical protein
MACTAPLVVSGSPGHAYLSGLSTPADVLFGDYKRLVNVTSLLAYGFGLNY